MEKESTTNHTFIEPNNVVIICLGLALLIVPVICAMVWVCLHKRVFHHVKIVTSKTGGTTEETIIPYSKFASNDCEDKPTLAITVPTEVRVLVYRENQSKNKIPPSAKQLTSLSSSSKPGAKSNTFVLTDDVICDTDTPTFKLPYAPPLSNQRDNLGT